VHLRFVEVSDGSAYGKFLLCRLTRTELHTPSAMPEAQGVDMLNFAGRRRFNNHSTLVIDLQRGTAAAWSLSCPVEKPSEQDAKLAVRWYMDEHLSGLRMLVCPLYLPFVSWLTRRGDLAMGAGDLESIPRYIDLREQA
jgi:hypothetical protein